MKFKIGIFLLFIFISSARAQIVNIESLRVKNDSSRWSGMANLSLSVVKNTTQLVNVNSNIAIQYLKKRSTLLLLSDVNLSFTENSDFERGGFAHLRYGYALSEPVTLETFLQYQINILLRIEERILLGTGPRFRLLNRERHKMFLGTLVMYENDQELEGQLNQDVRGSSYLSYTYKKDKIFSFSTIGYYQPRLDYFEDFRTSIQMQMQFQIWKNFLFTTSGVLAYDAFPVEDPAIPNLTYKITNGIAYSF